VCASSFPHEKRQCPCVSLAGGSSVLFATALLICRTGILQINCHALPHITVLLCCTIVLSIKCTSMVFTWDALDTDFDGYPANLKAGYPARFLTHKKCKEKYRY
jgi:hypothetical protein